MGERAEKLDQAPVSESEEKTVHVYFGIFFDAIDKSYLTQLLGFDRGEEMRKAEGMVSDVKSSSTYQTINEIEAYAKMATDILPNNPVSNLVNSLSEKKGQAENLVDDAFGVVSNIDKGISDKAGDIPTSFGTGGGKEDEDNAGDMVGARSIISRLEPNYIGVPFSEGEKKEVAIVKVSTLESGYNYRIYTKGSVTNDDVRKPDKESEISDGDRENLAEAAVGSVIGEIEKNIKGQPKKSLHFDIFGYAKDPALKKIIPEINKFKQLPEINEVSIDHEGKYNKFYDPDEVKNSMSGETKSRFRNLNKL